MIVGKQDYLKSKSHLKKSKMAAELKQSSSHYKVSQFILLFSECIICVCANHRHIILLYAYGANTEGIYSSVILESIDVSELGLYVNFLISQVLIRVNDFPVLANRSC